jgi:hypothetical protein
MIQVLSSYFWRGYPLVQIAIFPLNNPEERRRRRRRKNTKFVSVKLVLPKEYTGTMTKTTHPILHNESWAGSFLLS